MLGCWPLLLCGAPILGQQTGSPLTEAEGAADDARGSRGHELDNAGRTGGAQSEGSLLP